MSVVFDKLGFMRHLESEGTFARPQAEKLSEAFHQAVQESIATKADIERLEGRIERLSTATRADIERLEGRIETLSIANKADMDRIGARIDGLDSKFDARLSAIEAKIEARLDASLASMKVWTVSGLVAVFSALAAIRFFGH